jgi:hypothetical protein
MKSPIILEGSPFPWNEPNPHGPVVDGNGEVNWAAAAFADPGVTTCPGCGEYLWNEGVRVRCPDCATEFETSNGKWLRDRQARALLAGKGEL